MPAEPDLRAQLLALCQRIEEVCEAATRAPWTATQDIVQRWHIDAEYRGPEREYVPVATPLNDPKQNSAFIALARTALPAFVRWAKAEVERHEPWGNRPTDTCAKCIGSPLPCRFLRDLSAALQPVAESLK